MCVLRRLKHDNLMDMVGFSCDGQYPCVVYPLMPNGSLLDRLACLVSPHLAIAAGFGALSNIILLIFLPNTSGRESTVVLETEVFDS